MTQARPSNLQFPDVPLQQPEALLYRAPLDMVFCRVVSGLGQDAHCRGAPLREQRLEPQLELGLLLEVERVDLRAGDPPYAGVVSGRVPGVIGRMCAPSRALAQA